MLKLEIKILITIPITKETMQQVIIKPWRRSLVPWCRKNQENQKDSKNLNLQIFFKKLLKFVISKS